MSPDYCVTDFGLVELSPLIFFEAWKQNVPVWKICKEIAREQWENGARAPYRVQPAQHNAKRLDAESKNDAPYAFWLGAGAA